MGGVDNTDKDRKNGGSFTLWAIFKKLHGIGLMGILGFMVISGHHAWNMSIENKTDHFKLNNAEF